MLAALLSIGAVHLALAAVWFGAMSYSLFVVQPRAEQELGSAGYERLAQSLAAGQRYKVLALMAAIALTGAGLLAVLLGSSGAGEDRDTSWWTVLTLHAALLVAALAVFARVSWQLWPARIFALPDELPAVRRRFRFAAITLLGLVGGSTVLGFAAHLLRSG